MTEYADLLFQHYKYIWQERDILLRKGPNDIYKTELDLLHDFVNVIDGGGYRSKGYEKHVSKLINLNTNRKQEQDLSEILSNRIDYKVKRMYRELNDLGKNQLKIKKFLNNIDEKIGILVESDNFYRNVFLISLG